MLFRSIEETAKETAPEPVEEPAPKPAAATGQPARTETPAAETAVEKPGKGQRINFMGTINGSYEVKGTLYVDGDNITGRYAYLSTIRKYGDTSNSYIRLKGKIKPSGYFKAYGTSSVSKHVEGWQGIIGDGQITAIATGADGSPLELDASVY